MTTAKTHIFMSDRLVTAMFSITAKFSIIEKRKHGEAIKRSEDEIINLNGVEKD